MEEGAFVIGDPTDIERPEGKKTPYVGWLKNGKRGFSDFGLFGSLPRKSHSFSLYNIFF